MYQSDILRQPVLRSLGEGGLIIGVQLVHIEAVRFPIFVEAEAEIRTWVAAIAS
jgi:hypothetical protein